MRSSVHSLSYSTMWSNSILKFHSIPKIYTPNSIVDSNWIVANSLKRSKKRFSKVNCCSEKQSSNFRTCKNCKTQFDPVLNHPLACRFHTAHFGGETKRKFESVYTGGTMSTPNSGQVLEYWHCCGSEDPFDPGCTSAPHSSYDD
ncbi:Chromosome-associated kinesin KIF4 [Bienertia sinuspersici]